MIIELPLSNKASGRRYKMALFSFSNNNLSIRKRCAQELKGYDPEAEKSEDVDICFRAARQGDWVVCQEAAAFVHHRARDSVAGFLRQMWGWGWFLGYAYRKTGIRGVYVYWVASDAQRCKGSLELESAALFPGLAVCFLTDFHAMHAGLGASLLLLPFSAPAAAVFAAVGLYFLRSYAEDVLKHPLPPREKAKVLFLQYIGNVSFMSAAFLGALRRGVLFVPASIFRPLEDSGRPAAAVQ